jgi:hypothetical protein
MSLMAVSPKDLGNTSVATTKAVNTPPTAANQK